MFLLVPKRKRCGVCEGCIAKDCAKCRFCLDMKKFGGRGTMKQCCSQRKCRKLDNAKIHDEHVTKVQPQHYAISDDSDDCEIEEQQPLGELQANTY